MNNGKICVSVCAATADELIEQIRCAKDSADVIEIRFDYLEKSEIENFYSKLGDQWQIDKKNPFITTFRAKEQGGFRNLTQEEREEFWNSGYEISWADCEEDIIEDSFYWLWDKRICSYHDFDGVPNNLPEIYERLKATNADIIKIAIQANDITDAIAIWKILEIFKSDEKIVRAKKLKEFEELEKKMKMTFPRPNSFLQIIPIAMGESGKWTRILGLAHGAFMTYAALNFGKETAPGQISARDLIDIYRVKELDETTEIYGVIAGDTSYSMSPYIHNAAFAFNKTNAVFVPLQVKNLAEFIRRMVKSETREIELNFKGFAVTNPHKQEIIKYLDETDETAKQIGAVNTVKIKNGKLCGYNTDASGFIEPLLNAYGDLRGAKIAVCGAGGAARACVYALRKADAEVTIFARNVEKAQILAREFGANFSALKNEGENYNEFDILVNATPLGTKGESENETIVCAEQINSVKLVYDLIYNPFKTRLMQAADRVGVPKIGGLAMLVAQAAAQQKIWTGIDAPIEIMRRAALSRPE